MTSTIIVHDRDFAGSIFLPAEADSPQRIDPDAELAALQPKGEGYMYRQDARKPNTSAKTIPGRFGPWDLRGKSSCRVPLAFANGFPIPLPGSIPLTFPTK